MGFWSEPLVPHPAPRLCRVQGRVQREAGAGLARSSRRAARTLDTYIALLPDDIGEAPESFDAVVPVNGEGCVRSGKYDRARATA